MLAELPECKKVVENVLNSEQQNNKDSYNCRQPKPTTFIVAEQLMEIVQFL
jgi:hypothetical protein